MISWSAARLAERAGARLAALGADGPGPARAVVDSRCAGPGDLFVGLVGVHTDGGLHAPDALRAGARAVLVAPAHEDHSVAAARTTQASVLVHADPLVALQSLARAWRRALGAHVVAVTGSTGKTSTKDILAALLAPRLRTVANPLNLNTEVGLPLAVLGAPPHTEALVLEMGMRGPGQIAELVAVAEPDVGVIVNVGPVHLELLGSLEAVAAAKGELIDGLAPGATAVIPAHEPLLAPHLRKELRVVTFGADGDVRLAGPPSGGLVTVLDGTRSMSLRPSFSQAHNLHNLLAAVAAARAVGITPAGDLNVAFSALRGERLSLPGGVTVVNDCYNANPMSMRAALDDLVVDAPGRRVAVLGDMLELGPDELRFHREVGEYAARLGLDLLVTVGPLAAVMGEGFDGPVHAAADAREATEVLGAILREHDTVLIKASRGVGLEQVAPALTGAGLR